jgi:uracil-DNA glycosylase
MINHQRIQPLNALNSQLISCRLCLEAGYDIFPRAITSGGLGARLMTIGQAPGITEKEAGRPFNAGSGTRLFKWLSEAGIEETWFRRTQYMSSVTKCYPGRANSGSGDRVPTRVEQELCRPYLDQEISLIDPQVIIPIGRLAINLFYSSTLSLAKIIGTQKQVDDRWVVPLPHPSGASRWHQTESNRALVDQAIYLIRKHVELIFPDR